MIPRVSVIMSVYNSRQSIHEAVNSILRQSFGDFEFIIINDGSTDGTSDALASFSDPRIRVLQQENKGLTVSLNRAIREAKGAYIARMDADDVSYPTRLEKQVAFLDANPQIAMCGTQIDAWEVPTDHSSILKMMLFHNPFNHPTVMIRSSILKKHMYNERIRYAQDYELWTRIATQHETANLPEVLLQYRISPSGITESKKKTLRYAWYKLYIRLLFLVRLIKSIITKRLGNKPKKHFFPED